MSDARIFFLKEFKNRWFREVDNKLNQEKRKLYSKHVKLTQAPLPGFFYWHSHFFGFNEALIADMEMTEPLPEMHAELDALVDLIEQHDLDRSKCVTLVKKILNEAESVGDIFQLAPEDLRSFFKNLIQHPETHLPVMTQEARLEFIQEHEEELNYLKEYKFKTQLLYF